MAVFSYYNTMIIQQLNQTLKEAMVAHDEARVSILRMLMAALHNKEIEKKASGVELTDADRVDILKKELKKRKEAASLFHAGGRTELAEKEEKEASFIETLLPPQLSREDVARLVEKALESFSNPTQKDFGAIMKSVAALSNGQADGALVAQIVKEKIQ